MKSITMNISQFKQRSLGLLESIHGTTTTILITKHGKPFAIAQSTPIKPENLKPGRLKGTVVEEKDIVSPLSVDL